jgi:magnesium transporter
MTPPSDHKEERPIAALLAPDILALLDEAPEHVAAETEEMHPADLADIVEAIPEDRVVALLLALPDDRAAQVLEHLDEELRSATLEAMSARQAAQIVSAMSPDDRVDALDELEDETAEEILAEIPTEARQETEALLAFDPDTAGGLMTTEFVSVPSDTSVDSALSMVRAIARAGRRKAMHAIYVTDTHGRLRGVMSLRELLAAPEGSLVGDQAWSEVVSVPATATGEEVARITSNYDLVALPVVEATNRIIGVITVDDVIDVIQEEQTEDVQKLGGMQALDEPYMQIGFLGMLRKRAGWLVLLFVGELFTATAMARWEGQLERAAVLMMFVPLIISSGGNSGSQATSLIIRAMALQEVRLRDWWRVFARELPSGLVLGSLLGFLGFGRVVLWHRMAEAGVSVGGYSIGYDYGPHFLLVGATVGIALLGVVMFGTLMGSMLPFLLRRIGFDPASASAPFVATLVDVTGLVIYFTAATLLLTGSLL